MAIITTKKGQEIIVDDEDYASLSKFTWYISKNGYAVRNVTLPNRKRATMLMHRLVSGISFGDPVEIDHDNGIRYDNRKINLRFATDSENCANSALRKDNALGMKGVDFHRASNKYRARIAFKHKKYDLGLFETPELAHEFYCLAADMLHGKFANHGAR